MAEIEVTCPKCGSADIRGIHEAIAYLPVFGWERDANGDVNPTDLGEDDNIEWEWADVARQFICYGIVDGRRCDARYSLKELRVTPAVAPVDGRDRT